MLTKASVKGHPIHPMLVVVPLGLYVAGVASLLTYVASGSLFWYRAAYTAWLAGAGSALVAAVFGLIDLIGIRHDQRAREVGVFHAGSAVTMTALFGAAGFVLRSDWHHSAANASPPYALALVLAVFGLTLAVITGILGWNLVGRHRVGVEERIDHETPVVGTPRMR